MSNKPSYAAVAAPGPTPAAASAPAPGKNAGGQASQSGPSDAPPPYSAPSASHQTFPHQTILPQQANPSLESANEEGIWIQPTAAVARSRALKRFWLAFLWAWLIWIAIGLIIGGGVSDVETNPSGRHGHWDKHGEWHNDNIAIVDYLSAFQRRG
ncbi:hypothetical protein CI109_105680 [Kwoniella shandongensis]|uniref:Uncharacterized protein n=1 Tax=Kwoniella shandongensis TaxID=1734106 RepID=A0A5M6C024_9TREE|nr:uncharacterized protein CI109_003020 [Kwoniella shandongensis]KAA5528488.1 hypothetical protein CI109_003020 [Kwoniella shandongensis]